MLKPKWLQDSYLAITTGQLVLSWVKDNVSDYLRFTEKSETFHSFHYRLNILVRTYFNTRNPKSPMCSPRDNTSCNVDQGTLISQDLLEHHFCSLMRKFQHVPWMRNFHGVPIVVGFLDVPWAWLMGRYYFGTLGNAIGDRTWDKTSP